MKTFVTLFPANNTHLTKDVGGIPYGMYKFENYDAYITRYNSNAQFENINSTVRGLKIWDISVRYGNYLKDAINFLKVNANKIDVLNLYHFKPETYELAKAYKRYNPAGILYIKCDTLANNLIYFSNSSIKISIRRAFWRTLTQADLISVELDEGRSLAIQYFQRDIIRIANPIIDIFGYRDYKDRTNTILFVGRADSIQKNVEMLLEGFCSAHSKIAGWKLKIVGPINGDFHKIIDSILAKYPEAKQDIVFTGNISDRQKLREEYLSSKIVCMPSRWESFSISFLEGIATGNFMIGTDIIPFRYMTDNGKLGELVPIDDDSALSEAIMTACNSPKRLEEEGKKEYEFAIKNFSLKKICDDLEKNIEIVRLRNKQ